MNKFFIILLSIVIVLVIFGAGITVGYRAGNFRDRFDRHYNDIMSGHGAYGQVISTQGTSIVIRDPQNREKDIIVGPKTVIRRSRDAATTTDISVGSWITAIGSPDENGQIRALLIRIMPPPAELGTTSVDRTIRAATSSGQPKAY